MNFFMPSRPVTFSQTGPASGSTSSAKWKNGRW